MDLVRLLEWMLSRQWSHYSLDAKLKISEFYNLRIPLQIFGQSFLRYFNSKMSQMAVKATHTSLNFEMKEASSISKQSENTIDIFEIGDDGLYSGLIKQFDMHSVIEKLIEIDVREGVNGQEPAKELSDTLLRLYKGIPASYTYKASFSVIPFFERDDTLVICFEIKSLIELDKL